MKVSIIDVWRVHSYLYKKTSKLITINQIMYLLTFCLLLCDNINKLRNKFQNYLSPFFLLLKLKWKCRKNLTKIWKQLSRLVFLETMYGSAVLTLKSGSFLQVWVSLLHCCWLLLGLLALLSSNRAVQASLFSSFSMGLNSFTPWWWRMSHLSSRGLRGPFCLQRNLWARRQRLFCFPFSAFWWHKRRSNYVSELEFWENCNILLGHYNTFLATVQGP